MMRKLAKDTNQLLLLHFIHIVAFLVQQHRPGTCNFNVYEFLKYKHVLFSIVQSAQDCLFPVGFHAFI